MKIVFLGLLFSDDSLSDGIKYSRTPTQMATHNYQRSLIEGFSTISNVEVINIIPVGSFPFSYKKVIIANHRWRFGTEIGFLNLPFLKHSIQCRRLYKELKSILNENEEIHVIVYSLYKPFLVAVNKLKKKANFKLTLIQTDAVPGRNDMAKFMSKNAIKKGNYLISLTKNVDYFVVCSKYVCKPLEVGPRPFLVVECISNRQQIVSASNEKSCNICLYTGTLDEEFGIISIAMAFTYMKNAELWICGRGSAEDQIKNICAENKNIRYFGFLNKDEVYDIRNKCDFLINPRRPTGTYTLYSFPFKTSEYLMSGKPTIMYKLEGVPDEYDEYLNYLHSDDPKAISIELKKIFDMDYALLKEKAEKGRLFIAEHKNERVQAQRIIDFWKRNE